MLTDRIENKWIAAFEQVFTLSKVQVGDEVAILSESQSRPINVHLAELALLRMGATPFHVQIPSPKNNAPVPVRSTGASQAIQGIKSVLAALTSCPVIVDCTVEGLMHAPELPQILKSGARVLNISDEHPEALARLVPTEELKGQTLAASRKIRKANEMRVTSAAGTNLTANLENAPAVGIWGYTDKPGTLAHWPGGIIVSFPKEKGVNGILVLDKGDINLTFKRYLQDRIILTIENDYITKIDGHGTDYELMTRYLAAWKDPLAYATSHVGWGLNPNARYEALSMYDKSDTNGTEIRAYAGNFLFSTGANEFAGRFTEGHFDIPVRGCTISLDGEEVVSSGELVSS
ncbi:MAG: 2,5-dihydroxypyridine 5,6-dioxygenase [Cellvibrionaceae bacterium]|jgi:2,5-dihydroxypyridine 5,6-dioxygenase